MVKSTLVDGRGERARKPRPVGNAREGAQVILLRALVNDPRGHRLLAQTAVGCHAGLRERRHREAIGEGIQSHPMHAENRALLVRDFANEVVGGLLLFRQEQQRGG